jgi:hypothetical protein
MIFFQLSKVFWGVFAPSHILLWASVAAAISLTAGRQRFDRHLAFASAFLLIVMGVLPTRDWLPHPVGLA